MSVLISVMHSLQCNTKLTDSVTNKAHKLPVTAALYFLAPSCYGIHCNVHGYFIECYAEDSFFQGDCSEYHTKGSGPHIWWKRIKTCICILFFFSPLLGQKLSSVPYCMRFVNIKCNVGCDIVRSSMCQSEAVYIPYCKQSQFLCSILCPYLITYIPHLLADLAHTVFTSPMPVADFYLLIFPYYYFFFFLFGLVSWFFPSSSSSASIAPSPQYSFVPLPLLSSLHSVWVRSWLS